MWPSEETVQLVFMPVVYLLMVGCGTFFGQYKRKAPFFLVWAFYLYVFFNELLCGILFLNEIEVSWAYNIYMVVSFSFYMFWTLRILKEFRLFLYIAIAIFLFGLGWEYFLTNHTFLRNTLLVHNVGIIVASCLYFRELLLSDSVIAFTKIANFWFYTGLLFYYLGVVPAIVFQNQLMALDEPLYNLILRVQILMQSVFIIKAFAVAEKEYEY